MGRIKKFCKNLNLNLLPVADREWLEGVLDSYGNDDPSIKEMWALLDKVWLELGCKPEIYDTRVRKFYEHPVWLLNGVHIETSEESITSRVDFTNWVKTSKAKRTADFGGGFGTLARMLAAECTDCRIEIVEPHPSKVAAELSKNFKNLSYVGALTGKYDVIIITDVFEHVNDPIGLLIEVCEHLDKGSKCLIANCFEPVILCHLPQTFHFGGSWKAILRSTGLQPVSEVAYGMAYEYSGEFNIKDARRYEKLSKHFYSILSPLPRRVERRLLGACINLVVKYQSLFKGL